jgi:hypothetical protein
VLAFDVGTTYSGISYSILDPGQSPGINAVTRFPAQETISGASKIPTVIYYDPKGHVKAIGAEATRNGIYEAALEGDWYKAEWFKLHLRSKYGEGKTLHPNVPPLPPKKTVVDVFADFLRYLLDCSEAYIREAHPNGHNVWSGAKDDVHFVLSHPNGWEGKEQSQMRKAAVKAGLVPDNPGGHARISFVTEGEASLHFAIENGVLTQTMEGHGVVIVDAGGGTIDVSTYKRVEKEKKRTFAEIAMPQCYFHGSVFVTFNAKDHLKKLLNDSPFSDDLDHISDCFDKTTKPRFRNSVDPQYVKFGSARDNDLDCGIRFGQLKLTGSDVAGFFQPSIDCVVQAVVDQQSSAKAKISNVVLVGGFAASDWLFQQVKDRLTTKGLAVTRPENYVNKAVSDGAISFYLDHYVRARVAKVTYGSPANIRYKPSDPEHIKRSTVKYMQADGMTYLPIGFMTVLPKDTQVSESKEFTTRLHTVFTDSKKSRIENDVTCYRGTLKDPKWMDVERDQFTTLCTLVADISRVPKVPVKNINGSTYYSVDYDVILNFGLTELQAQLRWWESGAERRSPAKLIYDES